MARGRSPWMGTITLTTAATAYSLLTLLKALTNSPLFGVTAAAISIQLFVGTSNAKVYVGNDDVSATNYGFYLVGGQAGPGIPLASGGAASLQIGDIYLQSDTNSTVVGVTIAQN